MDPGLYEFSSYGAVLFFFLASIGLTVGMIAANRLLGAKSNPNPDKIESYECGEEPIGSAWLRFNIRFYMVALVFVIFDVELALVFPIANVLKDCVYTTTHPGEFVNPTALLVAAELLVFVAILFLGLIYLWKKNDLGWNRVYRENADIEELVQQRLAHLPPVKIRPRAVPVTAPVKPAAAKVAAAAPVTAAVAAPAAAGAAKPGIPAALAAKLAAAKAGAGGGAAPAAAAPAAPAAAPAAPAGKPGIPAALAAKLAAAKAAAAGGGAAPAAPAAPAAEATPVAPAAPAAPAAAAEPAKPGGIPAALAAKLAAAKAKAAGQTPPAEGGGGAA
ncbi:MAG TPA: NADH-quinone oxidoreductase subunit A [Planctomycetota bacterium]|nr:NADH-quinone oxidoreductase subunit A [Planctomycetota bacterium]